jgi:hypothetical protein
MPHDSHEDMSSLPCGTPSTTKSLVVGRSLLNSLTYCVAYLDYDFVVITVMILSESWNIKMVNNTDPSFPFQLIMLV